ncbi:hypothetical protein PTSG_01691 [Salpingoeca rosetta]|uniref:Tc1-like transposase DDE domain-containing protein n=1 Tax=Salpingoeca rosetta (strain ATCC 50818 / BSB-021) TaxID=946362 RepID=F2TYN7_SALR5|nr:uncharacterized protein PTSG_01691 [Salpingoeca rosetta]EGD78711.1 hypothetical protein PTSG_01691 [Salpingoeca rosetta]|eukprot:XP_004997668.1 hypothetical protein PTSG_01691 [Salpingoeca rosetta]
MADQQQPQPHQHHQQHAMAVPQQQQHQHQHQHPPQHPPQHPQHPPQHQLPPQHQHQQHQQQPHQPPPHEAQHQQHQHQHQPPQHQPHQHQHQPPQHQPHQPHPQHQQHEHQPHEHQPHEHQQHQQPQQPQQPQHPQLAVPAEAHVLPPSNVPTSSTVAVSVVGQVPPASSASSAAPAMATQSPRTSRNQTNDELAQEMTALRKLRGRSTLDQQSVALVLHCYLALKQKQISDQSKSSGAKTKMNYQNTVAHLLGLSANTVGKAYARWNAAKREAGGGPPSTVPVAGLRGNFNKKDTRVPVTNATLVGVREYVREQRAAQKRVTAGNVLEYLIERDVISVKKSQLGHHDKKDYEAATVAVQRFLRRAGYTRGTWHSIAPNEKHLRMRDAYIKAILDNRAAPPASRLREVYIGESYVHEHYHRAADSLVDPNDEQEQQVRNLRDGRRYCFAIAIQGADPRCDVLPPTNTPRPAAAATTAVTPATPAQPATSAASASSSTAAATGTTEGAAAPAATATPATSEAAAQDTAGSSTSATATDTATTPATTAAATTTPQQETAAASGSGQETKHTPAADVKDPLLAQQQQQPAQGQGEQQQQQQQQQQQGQSDSGVQPNVPGASLAGLVYGSAWVFAPKKTHSKCPHKGDFRKNFTTANFKKWWTTQLLPNLKQPSLIVMDDAKHHMFRPSNAMNPTRMKRDGIIAALRQRGLPAYDDETTNVLRARLRAWVQDNVKPELVHLAESQGHTVVIAPPGYPDLNPVEHAAAFIKGIVGHQHSPTTTFEDVLQRVNGGLDLLTCSDPQYPADFKSRVQSMIDSTDAVLDQQYQLAMSDDDGVVLEEDGRGRAFDSWPDANDDEQDDWYQGDEDDDDTDIFNVL